MNLITRQVVNQRARCTKSLCGMQVIASGPNGTPGTEVERMQEEMSE